MKIPRSVIDLLEKTLPATFTGSVTITLNVHKGTVGKVGIASERWTTWADWCAMAHGRPLPLQALDDANLLELERLFNINPKDRRS